MKKFYLIAAATAALALSVPAHAATTVVGPTAEVSPCTNFTFSVSIISCAGGYSGNLLNGSTLTDPDALLAVTALGGSGGTYLEPTLQGLSNAADMINFNTTLTGLTIFGMHVGAGGDRNGQGTFFFSFDAGAGTDVIKVTNRLGANNVALSNAALFKTGVGAVPEPATWMFMLIGMAGVGFSMRRKKDMTLRVRFT